MPKTSYKHLPIVHQVEIKKIGLFDSGVGGLSILKPLLKAFPEKEFIYYADNLYWPYGQKNNAELKNRCQYIQDFLISLNVDAMLIACNTMSALWMNQTLYQNIPVLNIIAPVIQKALQTTNNNKIGILATKGTVESQIYPRYLLAQNPDLQIYQNPSPLLSAWVEQKLKHESSCRPLLQRYLQPLIKKEIDTLILACTHYSFLIEEIKSFIRPSVQIVDSSTTCVEAYTLNSPATHSPQIAKYHLYTSNPNDEYTAFAKQLIHS